MSEAEDQTRAEEPFTAEEFREAVERTWERVCMMGDGWCPCRKADTNWPELESDLRLLLSGLDRLVPELSEAAPTSPAIKEEEARVCPTCGSDDPRWCFRDGKRSGLWGNPSNCPDAFHLETHEVSEALLRLRGQADYWLRTGSPFRKAQAEALIELLNDAEHGSDFPMSAERGCGASGKEGARDTPGQPARDEPSDEIREMLREVRALLPEGEVRRRFAEAFLEPETPTDHGRGYWHG